MNTVPKISYAVSHYASHFLHANVQFSEIEIIMQSMKTDMIHHLYGFRPQTKSFSDEILGGADLLLWLKGMNLLGFMEIR